MARLMAARDPDERRKHSGRGEQAESEECGSGLIDKSEPDGIEPKN
jgi:hypothetical protein